MNLPHFYLPLMLVLLVGCGDGKVKLPTAPVAGTVTYQGKPLSSGRIIFFHPSGQAKGADLVAGGTFKLIAFQGKNHVTVELREADRPGIRGKSLIPERYAEPGSSDLTLDVSPDEDNNAAFTLKD